jgi:RNA polymerase sigma-70 factor (ECF subfamily)
MEPTSDTSTEFDDGLSAATREGLVRRDPEALALFFEAYFPRIYGFVRRLVQRDHLAEDLTQEIFLHLQRGFDKYDPTRALRPWVFTIATNKLRDHWRSLAHRNGQATSSLEQEEYTFDVPSLAPGSAEQLSNEELAAHLRRAVEELPEGMRLAVQLRVFEGLSFEEIGVIMDRNAVAVRKRFSRALEQLREVMGPAWELHRETN